MISLPPSFTSQLFGNAGGNTPVMVVVAPQMATGPTKRVIGGVQQVLCAINIHLHAVTYMGGPLLTDRVESKHLPSTDGRLC